MPIAQGLKRLVHGIRAIPGEFGLRPYTVEVVLGTWNGVNTGRGARAREYLPITEGRGQPPKVRMLTTEELALGDLGKGSIRIGPITPAFAGGGTSIAALKPALESGQTLHLRITGPDTKPSGDTYLLKSINTDHAIHWTLTAEPVA